MTHTHKHWTPELAQKTQNILDRGEKRKSTLVTFIDNALYWIVLFVAIICNLVLSVALVPFLLTLTGGFLAFSLFIISASFGTLFSFIIHGIEKLKPTQHIIATIFIPALALINFAVITLLSNKIIISLHLSTTPHNPLLVGTYYVSGYVLPEIIAHYRGKTGHEGHLLEQNI